MTLKTDEAIMIAEQIKADIQKGDVGISQIIRLYYNLAGLIGNDNEAMWASEELDGYKNIKDVPDYRKIIPAHGYKNDEDVPEHIKNTCAFILENCEKLENKSKSNKPVYEYYCYSNNQRTNGTIIVKPEGLSDIVNILYNRVYRETTNILSDLKFGRIIETIFEDTKKLVDSKLVDICPDAIEKFTSAYERLKETNPESWAQAVTTCRRILKDFADAIYPPKDTLIKGRKVGKEEYINRLWAFASENIKSDTNKELIQSEVDYIGRRIDSLYGLTSKGTHTKISKGEAERAIIRTYLLIGDLITLGDL